MRILAFLLPFFTYSLSAIACDSLNCHIPDEAGRYREHNVDFIKLKLEVAFAPQKGTVAGKASYNFQPIQPVIDTLYLDAPGIKIDTVKLNGKLQKWQTNEQGVSIYFTEKLYWKKNYQLEIVYTAQPRKGLYFIGWNDPQNLSRKQIWTQGQGIDNRHWFPCYDAVNDRLITETVITFDSAYTVISNGKLLSKKKNNQGEYIWHYAMNKPHVPYLLMLAIDKFTYKDIQAKNGIVSRQYYYANQPETFEPTYQYSKEMMEWLPEEIGIPYPWEVYANIPVQDFMYGAMENTTATIFTDFYLQNKRQALERNYIATNAHELTHQWFGNLITEWSATHHWLHESFATYYAKLFMRKTFGEPNYEWNKRNEYEQAINADNRDHFPVAHSNAGSARHYPKGSAVLSMLRHTVGDSVYRKAVKNYVQKHQFGNVDTHDFWRAFMECCGINVDWFFDEWILHSGYPIFEISTDTSKLDYYQLTVAQTQQKNESGKLFTMPAEVKVYFTDGTFAAQNKMLSGNDTFTIKIPLGKKIAYTLFDEGDHILKKVIFNKPTYQLQTQALQAKHFIDRYDALVALRKTAPELKSDFLMALFDKNNYYPIQQEIIYQLRKPKTDAELALIQKAINHHNLYVRRAAIEYIDSIPEAQLNHYEQLLRDSSYITIETTLQKLCKLFPNQKAKFLDATKNIDGINRNVEITWLSIKAADEPETYARKLVTLTSNSYEFRTRTKAMNALENLNYFNDELVANLIDAATNPNSRLANPAANTIRYFLKRDKFKELYNAKIAVGNYPAWATQILNNIK